MTDLPRRLAEVMRLKMDYHKLDADQVSLACGVSAATIKNMLRADHVVRADTLIKLARFLKLDLSQFVTWEELASGNKEKSHGLL